MTKKKKIKNKTKNKGYKPEEKFANNAEKVFNYLSNYNRDMTDYLKNIETKSNYLLIFLIGLFAVIGVIIPNYDNYSNIFNLIYLVVFIVYIVLLIISIIFIVMSTKLDKIKEIDNSKWIDENFLNNKSANVLHQFNYDLNNVINSKNELLQKKQFYYKIALQFVMLDILLFAVLLILKAL